MNNKNLALLFSAGAVVVVLAVLVPVAQNRQTLHQQAAEKEHATQEWRSPHDKNYRNIITITLPPENQAYQAPNDTTPPTVTITSPQNGTQVQSNTSVTLSATASDNTGVSKVEFLVNGKLICTVTTSPYTCSWQTPSQPNTSYVIIARAYDQTGNLASQNVIVRTR